MKVEFTKKAQKQLLKAPAHCQVKALDWINQVESDGIIAVRMILGFHDEPLHGKKRGIRSVRLNKTWRMEYVEKKEDILIVIVEIHPHKY